MATLCDPASTTIILVARPEIGAIAEAARTSVEVRDARLATRPSARQFHLARHKAARDMRRWPRAPLSLDEAYLDVKAPQIPYP
jgi:hypothetical protein